MIYALQDLENKTVITIISFTENDALINITNIANDNDITPCTITNKADFLKVITLILCTESDQKGSK